MIALVAASTNATYTYDPVGNRQSVTGTVPGSGTYLADALNRYTAAPGGGAAYDPRGNLVAHAGRTLGYDSRNRLVNTTVGGHTITTTYDHRNRAVKRTVDGTATYFVWDDWSLIAELDASGGVLQRYIQGPGIDNLVAKTNSAGTVYYHQDGLGSTVGLTNATGVLVETYTYDAFGAVRILDPSTLATRPTSYFGNRFTFTGREWIAEASLYDYRNRAYDPELGRFLQTDPIQFEAGDVNLYRYVGNGAPNYQDPLGLSIGDPLRPDPWLEDMGENFLPGCSILNGIVISTQHSIKSCNGNTCCCDKVKITSTIAFSNLGALMPHCVILLADDFSRALKCD